MRRILATIVFAGLFGGVGQAQITRHAGSVQIQGTGAEALDNAGGAEFGSGNVELIGTDGKINGPLSTTIIDNLSAVNLTSIPSGQLTGTIDIARFPTGGTWTISSAFTFSSGGQVNIHNTGTNALDVAGGLNIGSGNVALVGTDGKINGPLSTTIIDNLSAVNLTSIPSGQLTGTIDIARFPTGGTWTISSDLTLSSGGNFRVLGGSVEVNLTAPTAPDLTTVYDDNVPSGWARVENSSGGGTASLDDDYNVSGATRTGTGIVRVDWDTNMPNTTYVVVVTPHEQSGGRPNTCIADTFLAASVVVTCFLGTVQDDTDFSIIAFAGP